MAFPSNPNNGDLYKNYKYDSSITGWVKHEEKIIISGQMGTALENPHITAPAKIPFNEFWTQNDITYDAAQRRFTVPEAGIYRITMNPFKRQDVPNYRVLVGVNEDAPSYASHKGHCYASEDNASASAGYQTGNINSVVELNAGDYIVFYLQAGALYNITHDRFNQFSIEKIA